MLASPGLLQADGSVFPRVRPYLSKTFTTGGHGKGDPGARGPRQREHDAAVHPSVPASLNEATQLLEAVPAVVRGEQRPGRDLRSRKQYPARAVTGFLPCRAR